MEKPKVMIVVVSYNGLRWINTCLKSCVNYPTIVVDNASSDETVSFIEANYPNVILLKQSVNFGFGQANNIGIRYALDRGAEHVFLLNQDAYLVDDVLDKLIDFQKKNSSYGILSPIHITGDKKKLDRNFANFMLKEDSGQFYSDFVLGNILASVYDVPFVNAAAWLISKKCLETVGGFDPLFFHYGEDNNYCQRVLFHDFKIGVVPNSFIIHDRIERAKVKPYSQEYYKDQEKTYKVKFANVFNDNYLVDIEIKIKQVKKRILRAILLLRIKNYFLLKRELCLLFRVKDEIKISQNRNRISGMHYLD